MGEHLKVSSPKYQQVAVDIAAKIVNREYQVGQRIYARSLLSSAYSVSPETARRAIAILADLEIVSTTRGSGVEILSSEKAQNFLRQFEETETLAGRRRNTVELLGRLCQDAEALKKEVQGLVDYSERFRYSTPFVPYEVPVQPGAACVGQSLQELNFWQNTGATVVAVRHQDRLILSPGPYLNLHENDIVYFVGAESVISRVTNLLSTPSVD